MSVCFTLGVLTLETAKVFSKLVSLFYIPTGNDENSLCQLAIILSDTWHHHNSNYFTGAVHASLWF